MRQIPWSYGEYPTKILPSTKKNDPLRVVSGEPVLATVPRVNDFFYVSLITFSSFFHLRNRRGWNRSSVAKVFTGFTPLQDQAASGFAGNLPTSSGRGVFPAKILTGANPYSVKLLRQTPSTPAPYGRKKSQRL